MRLTKFSQLSVMLAQIVLLISIAVIDLTQSSDSAAAFNSAKKVTSSENSLSPNRHKRRVTDEALFGGDGDTQQAVEALKRAPGWGKRFFDGMAEAEKRDPGWGKRSSDFDDEEDQDSNDKRAPGWGKRAPGWGKRSPGWGKRGWGKRAPGWGKRAPGWGKRSDESDLCQRLDTIADSFLMEARKVNAIFLKECGSLETGNDPFRK
uniref:APGWamide-like peptide n=1 Tax=Tritonia tetraquetra TaxID=2780533 RepID=I1SKI1_9GAST|nr:APGWamide-like peptide precursor [Tritonia tetraquetra]